MDITSLLQEAPSRDRTRRKQASWEENASGTTTARTASVGEELPPLSAISAPIGSDYPPIANKSDYPQSLYFPKQQKQQPEQRGAPGPEYIDVDKGGLKNRDFIEHSLQKTQDLLANPTDAQMHSESALVNILPPPPRTPSPVLDAAHLGIYIYPSLPFPIRPSSLPYNRKTTLTVLVSSSLLPHHHNATNKTNGIYADSRAHRLWGGSPQTDARKMYTDDSDVVFAALHSESIPDDQSLFTSGQDLKLLLRLYPAPESGHFTGGTGAAGLTSASWGNAHEGCAYTILEATWVPPTTARSYTRQTRKARMAEYAQRRAVIMSSQPTPFLFTLPQASQEIQQDVSKSSNLSGSLPLRPEMHPIEEEMASLSVGGGWRDAVGFRYNPVTLYLMLFFAFSDRSHAGQGAKRRKLDHPRTYREVILENSNSKKEEGRIVLVPKPPVPQDDAGAMDVDDPSGSPSDTFMRYDLCRETLPSTAPKPENEPVKPKGVRFAEVGIKDEEESWTRTLLHSGLSHEDILFQPDCLIVQDEKYVVKTWRWKSNAEDAKRVAEWVAQLAKTKKHATKRRRVKKKVKSSVVNEAQAKAGAAPKTETETPAPAAPQPEGGASAAAEKEAPPPPVVDVPVAANDDREEGELSDETPAAA
ncbi:hypothetical protein M408DRAFT_93184 [Serendipita vermifera MAFF 305830]|uniref:Uncharacterized protein n=1 Tax=Serendipita vermifera MAFF 305830 TaxID=933852 RepID=A0A0C2X881_SERVB|nr:hypothetical protein M408DRAFT_93184 [Serendipita vermifera MAFF 305830]